MASKLNPFSGRQFLDANGDPYSGAQLFIYSAGSSTKVTTTKDSDGLSAHVNPIILNSRGEPGDGSGASQAIWQTEGTAVKLVLAPSTDTDPPVAAISTWDNISAINDTTTTIDQWIGGPTPTFIDATSFSLAGDKTTDFHVGRRLKTTNSGGTIYSTIITSDYTTLTTITVINDSGSLDSGLSAVDYGILTYNNKSAPSAWKQGADVASASALPVLSDGNYFDVTGTTAITSINTLGVNSLIKLHFDDALTLTHHATDLVLPGGLNITTAAGDEAEFIEYATGDWRCLNYVKANGVSILGSVVQEVITEDSAVATGTTIIPMDDTIPQNTEGNQYITVSITPKSASHKLIIEAKLFISSSTGAYAIAALFQDSTAGALATSSLYDNGAELTAATITHEMTAGTTSSTTFKVRAGLHVAGTMTFNGIGGTRRFGGTCNSYIKVTEVLP